MSFDKFIILKENILFWHKMRLKMHFCVIQFEVLGIILQFEKVSSQNVILENFRGSKEWFGKVLGLSCNFTKVEGPRCDFGKFGFENVI